MLQKYCGGQDKETPVSDQPLRDRKHKDSIPEVQRCRRLEQVPPDEHYGCERRIDSFSSRMDEEPFAVDDVQIEDVQEALSRDELWELVITQLVVSYNIYRSVKTLLIV